MKLTEIFEDYDIDYWTSGKNVQRGWINIQCMFCDDNSNHLGIRKKDLKVHCWRCGKNNIEKVLQEITGTTYKQAALLTESISLGASDRYSPPIAEDTASSMLSAYVRLPQESTKRFPKRHIDYLKKRGFSNPKKIIKKYKLRAVYTIGKYKFRIIIPIIRNRKILSFTSRDITELQIPKYKNATPNESAMQPKKLIYNYDSLTEGSDAILVEGPMDVWKIGDGAVSFLGVNYTEDQIVALKNKKIRNLFVLFDNDAAGRREARKVARTLAPLVKITEVVTFENIHDPGELRPEEAKILRSQLGFKA